MPNSRRLSRQHKNLPSFRLEWLTIYAHFRDQRVKTPGGGGYSTKFYTGRLRPEVQPLTLLYTIFDRKGLSLVYLLLTNGTTFKTIPGLEFCIPFNCRKCIAF